MRKEIDILMPETLRNDTQRKNYVDDPENWTIAAETNEAVPLVRIERLRYKTLEFFKVCIREEYSTNWYDGSFHRGKPIRVKRFDDHHIYYMKNEEKDAFIRIQKGTIIDAIRSLDNAGGSDE